MTGFARRAIGIDDNSWQRFLIQITFDNNIFSDFVAGNDFSSWSAPWINQRWWIT
jgi:hypothetical protein